MPDPLPVEAFSHVCVRVSDVERSLAFYRDLLGFDTVFDVELEGPSLETVTSETGARGRMVGGLVGGAMLELLQIESATAAPTKPDGPMLGYTNISFSLRDLDAAHAGATAAGHTVGPIVDIGGVRMFFVADPDGTPIEVIEYPGDAKTSAQLWRGPGAPA